MVFAKNLCTTWSLSGLPNFGDWYVCPGISPLSVWIMSGSPGLESLSATADTIAKPPIDRAPEPKRDSSRARFCWLCMYDSPENDIKFHCSTPLANLLYRSLIILKSCGCLGVWQTLSWQNLL